MIGSTIGPYRLDRELGSGGMGRVWRAEATRKTAGLDAGTVVAVKVVHAQLLETEGFFKRFLREAEIGKSVVHENVVRTFDCDQIVAGGAHHCFLVMEYVEGQTLRGLLKELDRVPEELCRHVGREVAKGLAAIHAAGVVHRDMKPENVLITKEHAVKVMDLGVARLADESLRLSQSGAFVGSVEYAAPEQFGGKTVGPAADLHALGVVLYELATAQHPYRGDDFRAVMRKVLDEAPRRAGDVNPQLSPFFEEVVHTLLAKKPEDRFAEATALVAVLEDGEKSEWWKQRAKAIRAETKRPLRRIRIPRETAVYGRDAELSKLRALYDKARSGDGQVVLLEGEAGIGKSRLVDELVGRLQRDGEELNFLFGSYPPGGAATAAGAFSTAFREHLGDAGATAYLSQTPVLVPAFDALLRGEPTPTGCEPLTKDSLQTCFVHVVRNLAAERPTILLIDDLHFANEEARALFTSLAMAVLGHRVLLVGTARPGIDERWTAELTRLPQTTPIPVGRLGPKDLALLLKDSFKSEALAQSLGVQIGLKSDGNPFFAFEIIRGLREGQFITQRDDGTWVGTRVIDEIQIPSSVLDLVNARVADLTEDERNILDVASCWGFEFDPLVVGDALGLARVPLLRSLGQIERRHRLVRSQGRTYSFDHHQVQEALYGALNEYLREEYHASLATALEARVNAANADPKALDGAVCVDLAEHLLLGAQGERALRYLDAALTHLERGHLNDATARLADRALEAKGLLAGGARCDLLLRKSERLALLGRHAVERAALDEAIALADADGDPKRRVSARVHLGTHFERGAAADEAVRVCGEARDLARAAGDLRGEVGAALQLSGATRSLGRYTAAQELNEWALESARKLGDPTLELSATLHLAITSWVLGRNVEAQTLGERCVELSRATGDRPREHTALATLAVCHAALGRFADARAIYDEVLERCRETGDRFREAIATGNQGNAFTALGLYDAARVRFGRSLALAREIGARQSEAIGLVNLGHLLADLGDVRGARAHLSESLALSRAIAERRVESYGLQYAGVALDEAGDAAGALENFERAAALRREIGYRGGLAHSLAEIGALHGRAGRVDAARAALDEAVQLARESGEPDPLVLSAVARARYAGGDAGEASAVVAELGARLAMVDRLRTRFLLWQTTSDVQDLSEAKRLLDHLVANAPAECREPMLANVRLHREVAEACKGEGL